MSAASISDAILSKCLSLGLNLDRLLGQGYDGCSTMAGKDNGVQSRIRMKYPKAAFVHCSSHRLNLVVNDLSALPQIRNTIGTIKSIIGFFRESPKRSSMIPNVPLLCETRWTAKYKSIRVFCDNFDQIFTQLDVLSNEANGNTRQLAHQLLLASSSTTFLFGLIIISFYSALLEPCTQALQAIQLDLPQVQRHIHELLLVINLHRNKADMHFSADIYKRVIQLSGKLNIQLTPPRQCSRQLYRNNCGATDTNVKEYFRQAMYIPYLDSLIDSLQAWFSEDNIAQFNLCLLHPAKMRT